MNTDSYLIKNVNIIDGTAGMEVKEGYDIMVKRGKIAVIGRNISFKGKVIDQSGTYVIPGLINMHVHLPASGKVGKKKVGNQTGLAKLIKSNPLAREIGISIGASGAKAEVLSGVTTIRAVGGVGDCDSRLAFRVSVDRKPGPRIIAANEAICTPGGHMEGTVAVSASSVEEAVQLVEKAQKSGSDFIKLMITGGVLDCKEKGHPGELKMPEEMVKACCDKAHELGLKVAAHVEGPEGMEIAARCGVDTIEHGAPVSEEAIASMKENNSALICTFSPAIPLYKLELDEFGYDEDVRYNSEVLMNGFLASIKPCLENGIPVGLGTDTGCPFVTHYDMWRELYYFEKYIDIVDNRFAIHTATAVNAKILGMDNETGTIEVGKYADLMFVRENPLEDLRALREPVMVIAAGKIYTGKNKKFANVEETLDGLM